MWRTMNRIQILILLLLIFHFDSFAQVNKWDTAAIAPELRKDAYAVKRMEEIVLEVSDLDKMKLHVHRVETVLNEKGKQFLLFVQETDKFSNLDDIDIKVFDARGTLIKKYKEHDITAVVGVEAFIDDHKIYFLNVDAGSYPVTVEMEYSLKFKGTFQFPPYQILKPNESVEHSRFTARINEDVGFRYKEKNIYLSPSITKEGNYDVYEWSVSNLQSMRFEENASEYGSQYPAILLAPNRFELEKNTGNLTTWKDFGYWYNELLTGLDSLSDQRKAFYRELVRNAADDRGKEIIIYNYLKKNFRYISIQLGIGGLKPASAEITDEKKYGDCKALSNYMKAVLNCLNIKSSVALVNAGPRQETVDEDFPCDRFNHMIVCIPGEKDSTWLECTSRTSDFGVLGNFTENRNALLITDNSGGVLVPTPRSKPSENVMNSYSSIDLQEDGSGKTKTIFNVSGEYKQDMLGLKEDKPDVQTAFMINRWGFKDPGQPIFTDNDRGKNMQIELSQQLTKIPELKTGNKMFLRPSVVYIWNVKMPKAGNRRQDYYFDCPFEKSDTSVIRLPKGYVVDDIPAPVNDSCIYGHFSSKCWYDAKSNEVFSTAKLDLKTYKIPPSDYAAVKKFFDMVLQHNEERLVVRKD
jgi:hypothetical protein